MKIRSAILGTAAGLVIALAAPAFAATSHHPAAQSSSEQRETARLNQQELQNEAVYYGSAAGTAQTPGNGEVEAISNEPGAHYGSMRNTTIAPANGTGNTRGEGLNNGSSGRLTNTGYNDSGTAANANAPMSDTDQPVHHRHHRHHRHSKPANTPSNENSNGGNGIGSANGQPPMNGTTPETAPSNGH